MQRYGQSRFHGLHGGLEVFDTNTWRATGSKTDKDRYVSMLGNLTEMFRAADKTRKKLTTATLYDRVLHGADPDAPATMAEVAKAVDAPEWLPPTYSEYLTVWNFYGNLDQTTIHFFNGLGPIVTAVTATAVPSSMSSTGTQAATSSTATGANRRRLLLLAQARRRRYARRNRGRAQQQSSGAATSPSDTYTVTEDGQVIPVEQIVATVSTPTAVPIDPPSQSNWKWIVGSIGAAGLILAILHARKAGENSNA